MTDATASENLFFKIIIIKIVIGGNERDRTLQRVDVQQAKITELFYNYFRYKNNFKRNIKKIRSNWKQSVNEIKN